MAKQFHAADLADLVWAADRQRGNHRLVLRPPHREAVKSAVRFLRLRSWKAVFPAAGGAALLAI
jgi:hypothetical protein